MVKIQQGSVFVCGALALLPVFANAANTVVFAGVGSSAMFNVFRAAALTQGGGSQASNAYQASNSAFVLDTSAAGIPDERGNLWVVWDNGTATNRRIWFYLSVDSTVGVRSYFNSAKLKLASPLPAPSSGFAALPADVSTSIANAVFNAGMTDITAADAKVATASVLANYPSGNPAVSTPIQDVAGNSTRGVNFAIGARPFVTRSIGASPVMVFVNKTLTGVGDLGNAANTNINRFQLGFFLDGTLGRTRDLLLSAAAGITDIPVTTYLREPLSGTYGTMENCIPASVELNSSQELGVDPANDNPLNQTGISNGVRIRSIGTGALTARVAATPNSLGYAFWSTGNFPQSGATFTNTKYLTVDGVDPILDAYAGGTYVSGVNVTFKNVLNGSYPIWSLLRAVTPATISSDLVTYFNTATTSSSGGNFVAKDDLLVFRSHRATADVASADNGNNGSPESGADAGGAVFPINADRSYFNDFGSSLVGLKQ